MKWRWVIVCIAAASSTASAEKTCNADQSLCCDWWTLDFGPGNGSILERTFAELQQRLDKGTLVSRRLCQYFGPDDSTCSPKTGTPRCLETRTCSASASWDSWTQSLQSELDAVGAWKPPWAELATGAGDLLSLLDKERNPFVNVGTVLLSHGLAVGEMLSRVRSARDVATSATATGLHFLSAYGVYGEADQQLVGLWNQGGSFAGAAELDDVACEREAIASNVSRSRTIATKIGKIAKPPMVSIPASAGINEPRKSRSGGLVVGGWPKIAVGPGPHPIAWVSRSGTYDFNVEVRQEIGSAGETVIRIIGGPADDRAEITIHGTAPDRDGDRIIDVHDKCPDQSGVAPTGCPVAPTSSEKRCGEVVPEYWFRGNSMTCGSLNTFCTNATMASDEMDRRCRGEISTGPIPRLGSRCVFVPPTASPPPGSNPYTRGPTNQNLWCVP